MPLFYPTEVKWAVLKKALTWRTAPKEGSCLNVESAPSSRLESESDPHPWRFAYFSTRPRGARPSP
jgi:hypothetical protein